MKAANVRMCESANLRITNVRITNHESRITNHESRITNHESRITKGIISGAGQNRNDATCGAPEGAAYVASLKVRNGLAK